MSTRRAIGYLLLLFVVSSGLATAQTARLSNISTRAQVLTGNNVVIAGFVIQGTGQQTVAIVATGPSLLQYGISNFLSDPMITLVRASDQAVIASNDDWAEAANASVLQATGYSPSHPLEAALIITLNPGAYTAIVSGFSGATGVSVVGVYEVTANQALLNASRLIGGTWTFVYTILSTFADSYTLTTLNPTPGSGGQYFVNGTGSAGDPVVADYHPQFGNWSLLDPGSVIDRFFVFNFSDNNHVSGCYYQISPPGSSNMSSCYAMAGIRSPFQAAMLKDAPAPANEDAELLEHNQRAVKGFMQPGVEGRYLEARQRLR
jgi:hypothetical protein